MHPQSFRPRSYRNHLNVDWRKVLEENPLPPCARQFDDPKEQTLVLIVQAIQERVGRGKPFALGITNVAKLLNSSGQQLAELVLSAVLRRIKKGQRAGGGKRGTCSEYVYQGEFTDVPPPMRPTLWLVFSPVPVTLGAFSSKMRIARPSA